MDKMTFKEYITKKYYKVFIVTLLVTSIILSLIFYNIYRHNYINEKERLERILTYFINDINDDFFELESKYNNFLRLMLLDFYKKSKGNEKIDINEFMGKSKRYIEKLNSSFKVKDIYYFKINKNGVIYKTDYKKDKGLNLSKHKDLWSRLESLHKAEVLLLPIQNKIDSDNGMLFGYIKLSDEDMFALGISFKGFKESIQKRLKLLERDTYLNAEILGHFFIPIFSKETHIDNSDRNYLLEARDNDKLIIRDISLFVKNYYMGWYSRYGNHYIKVTVEYSLLIKLFFIMLFMVLIIPIILTFYKNKLLNIINKTMLPLNKLSYDMAYYKENKKSKLSIKDTNIEEIDNIANNYKDMVNKINKNERELKLSYKKLEKSYSEINELANSLERVINLTSKLSTIKMGDERSFLSNLLKTAIKIIPQANYGSVYLYKDDRLEFINAVGHNIDLLNKAKIPSDTFNIRKNEIKIVRNIEKKGIKNVDKKRAEYIKKGTEPMEESMFFAIFVDGKKNCGISLDIAKGKYDKFSESSIRLMRDFKNIVSVFYSLKSYYNMNEKYQKEIVLSFTNMLEIHDKYTENHSREVANKAKRLAKFLGLNEKDIRDAYWAGIVHDIGKILIPSYILNKKGKLTDDEFFLIKKHPLWGYETLKNSDKLKDISEYVLYHHERWDGFGYPLGLKGDNIPLISQILAVADTWDAMRSNRSYRKALPKKEAIKEIRKNKGTQFSPRVVDVFLENIEKFK